MGQGRIGALAGAGLRSTGNDGRFIALRGIREIEGIVSVREIIQNTDIRNVATVSAEPLEDHEIIDTRSWVRPSLKNGQPVLTVAREADVWCPAERRKKTD